MQSNKYTPNSGCYINTTIKMIIQGVKLSPVLANLRRQQIKYALLFCNMLLHSLNR